MLKTNVGENQPTRYFGFIMMVEVEPGVSEEVLADRLKESLQWIEGVGKIEVNFVGELEEKEMESNVKSE